MLTPRQRGSGRQRDCRGGVPRGAFCPRELWWVLHHPTATRAGTLLHPRERCPTAGHTALRCWAELCQVEPCHDRLSCAKLALMVLVPGGTMLCWAKPSCAVPSQTVPALIVHVSPS